MDIKKVKKVLIIRLSAIGDTIHTLPLAAQIKKYNKNIEIGWVVEDKAKEFVENNPLVDKVYVVPKKRWKERGISIRNFFEFVKIVNSIQKERYDIAIDTQQLLKSGIFLFASGAKERITNSDAREFSQIFANKIITPKFQLKDQKAHVVKRNLDFANAIGITPEEPEFIIPIPNEKSIKKVQKLLKKVDFSLPVITLAPATTWETKHWDEANWKGIVDEFSPYANIIITGSEADKPLAKRICAQKESNSIINLAGKTNLEELAQVFRCSNVVIAPDSGSAHIAWATQAPYVITIFTSTSKDRTGPFGKKCFSIQGELDCQPCHKKKCKNTSECTHLPHFSEIVKIVKDILHNF